MIKNMTIPKWLYGKTELETERRLYVSAYNRAWRTFTAIIAYKYAWCDFIAMIRANKNCGS